MFHYLCSACFFFNTSQNSSSSSNTAPIISTVSAIIGKYLPHKMIPSLYSLYSANANTTGGNSSDCDGEKVSKETKI